MPNPSELEREYGNPLNNPLQEVSGRATRDMCKASEEARQRHEAEAVALRKFAEARNEDKEVSSATQIEALGKHAPVVQNAAGGRQSFSPFDIRRIPQKAILALAAVVCKGHWKYDDIDTDERNWKSLPIGDNINHVMVHLAAYESGDRSDSHLAHAACRAMFALEQLIEQDAEEMDRLVADAKEAYENRMSELNYWR